jgi:hypothetical protein
MSGCQAAAVWGFITRLKQVWQGEFQEWTQRPLKGKGVRDRRGRETLGPGIDQRRQGLTEISRADRFEVEPGNQLLGALRPPQVRRQNLGREGVSLLGRSAIEHPRLFDGHRTTPVISVPLGQMAVADNLAVPSLIVVVLMRRHPLGDLGLDGFGQ